MNRLPNPPADALPPARARCPRCGAALGTLAADEQLYCGCCGLVLAAPAPAGQDA